MGYEQVDSTDIAFFDIMSLGDENVVWRIILRTNI
jgi:hypothetical protein